MKSESLIIAFEGEEHQIDANTLINTLIHYNALINQINEMVGKGEKKIELKVNAPERGSFIIDITLNAKLIETIFSSEIVNYTASIITILGGVFATYQFLKGKPIKEEGNEDTIEKIVKENNITITNSSFVTIYNNTTIRSAISKSIETASEDDAVEGISVSNRENRIVSIRRDEFDNLIYSDFDKEGEQEEQEEEKHVVIDGALLGIVTLSFDKKKNWEFIYEGFKINMPMRDSGLSSLIDDGMRFAKGDSIVVKLEIVKKYNPVYNAYQNKKFRIVEFLNHIPRPEQGNLNF
jgi:hypothetical protein